MGIQYENNKIFNLGLLRQIYVLFVAQIMLTVGLINWRQFFEYQSNITLGL